LFDRVSGRVEEARHPDLDVRDRQLLRQRGGRDLLFFKTLKSELVWRTVFQTRAEARGAIGRYIDGFYNPVRRHSTLDYVSPVQFERLAE